MRRLMWLVVMLSCVGFVVGADEGSESGLKPGDKAPAFALQGTDGKTHRLADYDRAVVLAWFPKAFTSG